MIDVVLQRYMSFVWAKINHIEGRDRNPGSDNQWNEDLCGIFDLVLHQEWVERSTLIS